MNRDHLHIDIKLYNSDTLFRNNTLRSIFSNKKLQLVVRKIIGQMGGNVQDAEDMFQEGLIVLDRNIRNGKYRHEGSVESYFISTCKLLWMNAARKKSRMGYTDDLSTISVETSISPEEQFLKEEEKNILSEALSQLDERSQAILKLWRLSYSMKEIAFELNISSEGMARKLKFQSMKKLVSIIKRNKAWKDKFNEEEQEADHLFVRAKNKGVSPYSIKKANNQ